LGQIRQKLATIMNAELDAVGGRSDRQFSLSSSGERAERRIRARGKVVWLPWPGAQNDLLGVL
jgi:hypothetical protein